MSGIRFGEHVWDAAAMLCRPVAKLMEIVGRARSVIKQIEDRAQADCWSEEMGRDGVIGDTLLPDVKERNKCTQSHNYPQQTVLSGGEVSNSKRWFQISGVPHILATSSPLPSFTEGILPLFLCGLSVVTQIRATSSCCFSSHAQWDRTVSQSFIRFFVSVPGHVSTLIAHIS